MYGNLKNVADFFMATGYFLRIIWNVFKDLRHFEEIAGFVDKYNNYIPLSFMLGFYVSLVINRFWQTYNNIAWPDK